MLKCLSPLLVLCLVAPSAHAWLISYEGLSPGTQKIVGEFLEDCREHNSGDQDSRAVAESLSIVVRRGREATGAIYPKVTGELPMSVLSKVQGKDKRLYLPGSGLLRAILSRKPGWVNFTSAKGSLLFEGYSQPFYYFIFTPSSASRRQLYLRGLPEAIDSDGTVGLALESVSYDSEFVSPAKPSDLAFFRAVTTGR